MRSNGEAEAERLAVLRALAVLGNEPDPRLDKITRRAAEICGTPIAGVALIDADRQWFPSIYGTELVETPRAWSVSAHLLRGPTSLVVPDLADDDRFVDNPLVNTAGLRFWAGIRLEVEGQPVGALFLTSAQPRSLAADDLATLRELAGQAEALLEVAYHRTERFLTLARYGEIVDSSVAGVCEIDTNGVAVYVNEAMATMLGGTPADLLGTDFRMFIWEEDVDLATHRFAECLAGTPKAVEVRLRRRDGSLVWAHANTAPTHDAEGRIAGAAAIVVETSAAKVAERALAEQKRQLQSIVSHLPGVVYVGDNTATRTLRYASDACRDVTGYAPEELVDDAVVAFGDLIVEEDRDEVATSVAAAAAAATPFTVNYRIRHRDGSMRWIWEHGSAQENGQLEGLVFDVTARVAADVDRQESDRRYRDLVEHSPDAILLSQDGCISYANPAATALLAPPCDLRGHELDAFIHPQDRPAAAAVAAATELDGRDQAPVEYRIVTGTGRVIEVEARYVAVLIEGRPGTETILRDISERIRSERVRAALQGVFEKIAAGTPITDTLEAIARIVEDRLPGRMCSIMLVEDDRLRDVAAPSIPAAFRAAVDGIPVTPEDADGRPVTWRGDPVVVADIAADPGWCEHADAAREAGLAACWSLPIALHDGTLAASFAVYASEPCRPDDHELEVLAELRDLTAVAIEHTTSRAALEHGASYDDLTGLPNRRSLRAALREALERADPQERVAVLFVDLDDFKDVNDSLGHAAGDEVLKAVAEVIEVSVRDGDFVARFSGDEFVVCCERITSPDEVEDIVHRLRAALRRPFHGEGQELRLRGSIGIAVSDGNDTPERLLANADAAMYRAKESGDGGRAWFDEGLRDRATRRLDLEAALGRALDAGELDVHYQPKVRLSDGCIVGAEALARWTRPDHGPVSPAEFIAVAESTGAIVHLGDLVLRRACLDAATWYRTHPDRSCPVSVNVSTKQLHHRGLVASVVEALTTSGLPPELLCLEVTESILVSNEAAPILDRLREIGVAISIDDFGTGYSSLSYLRRFPLDQLKVDRSFVAELDSNAEDGAIVAAVIAVADAIGADVVAEGVETDAQALAVAAHGCPVGQGFLWSPAVPSSDLTAMLGRTGCFAPSEPGPALA